MSYLVLIYRISILEIFNLPPSLLLTIHFPPHRLDPDYSLPSICSSQVLPTSSVIQNKKILKKKPNTLELDKTNQQKEKIAREGTRIRGPLICTLRTLIKTLNWKPSCIYGGPDADPCRPCVCCLSLCELI